MDREEIKKMATDYWEKHNISIGQDTWYSYIDLMTDFALFIMKERTNESQK